MTARLYVIPGSHPSMSARLMLEHKGVPYARTDLIPVLAKGVLRAARFPGATVPALTLDGRRIQGSRKIARALDELRPQPPLFPSEPAAREAVEGAERWGDEQLQAVPRRLVWWALRRDNAPLASFSEGARLGVPVGLATKTSPPIIRVASRLNRSTDTAVRADLARLPGMLDLIDGWIGDGVLAGEQLNAADFQIAPSVRLLMSMDDLRPAIEGRPAGRMALRVAPDFPGRVPPVLPAAWLSADMQPAPAT